MFPKSNSCRLKKKKMMAAFDFGLHPHMLKTAMMNQPEEFAFKVLTISKIRIFSQSCFSDNYLKEKKKTYNHLIQIEYDINWVHFFSHL